MNLLQDTSTFKCSVSSVLNKDVKQYGKSFLFDNRNDTSWASDHGTPQWIALAFEEPQKISTINIQFQGGFAGKETIINFFDLASNLIKTENIYPEDVNAQQIFQLKSNVDGVAKMKIIFESSTDFFGRIIVYNIGVL